MVQCEVPMDMDMQVGRSNATLRTGWSQNHLEKKKKYIYIYIYNNLKNFICLPFKKILGTFLVFFYANKIKFWSIICSTFSGWMIAWLCTLKKI